MQLRDKALDDDGLIQAARVFRAAADDFGALFILNDRPDLVAACTADGVHVGQDDATPAAARAAVGPELIVGRSTHAPDQGAARRRPGRRLPRDRPGAHDADQAGAPGGRARVRRVGRRARRERPWFAIGGLNAGNVGEVVERGARRIVVVRALTEAADPRPSARALRARWRLRVGAAQP